MRVVEAKYEAVRFSGCVCVDLRFSFHHSQPAVRYVRETVLFEKLSDQPWPGYLSWGFCPIRLLSRGVDDHSNL